MSVEVSLAGLRIANQNVQLQADRDPARGAALGTHGGENAVNVLGRRHDIVTGKVDGWLVPGETAADELSVQIVHGDSGAKEIVAFTGNAPHVGSMAGSAIGSIEGLAAQQDIRRGQRPNKLRESVARTAPSSGSTPGPAGRWRLRRRLLRGKQKTTREYHGNPQQNLTHVSLLSLVSVVAGYRHRVSPVLGSPGCLAARTGYEADLPGLGSASAPNSRQLSRQSGSFASASGRILIAASRFSLANVARYTAPMPPSPTWDTMR